MPIIKKEQKLHYRKIFVLDKKEELVPSYVLLDHNFLFVRRFATFQKLMNYARHEFPDRYVITGAK